MKYIFVSIDQALVHFEPDLRPSSLLILLLTPIFKTSNFLNLLRRLLAENNTHKIEKNAAVKFTERLENSTSRLDRQSA